MSTYVIVEGTAPLVAALDLGLPEVVDVSDWPDLETGVDPGVALAAYEVPGVRPVARVRELSAAHPAVLFRFVTLDDGLHGPAVVAEGYAPEEVLEFRGGRLER